MYSEKLPFTKLLTDEMLFFCCSSVFRQSLDASLADLNRLPNEKQKDSYFV